MDLEDDIPPIKESLLTTFSGSFTGLYYLQLVSVASPTFATMIETFYVRNYSFRSLLSTAGSLWSSHLTLAIIVSTLVHVLAATALYSLLSVSTGSDLSNNQISVTLLINSVIFMAIHNAILNLYHGYMLNKLVLTGVALIICTRLSDLTRSSRLDVFGPVANSCDAVVNDHASGKAIRHQVMYYAKKLLTVFIVGFSLSSLWLLTLSDQRIRMREELSKPDNNMSELRIICSYVFGNVFAVLSTITLVHMLVSALTGEVSVQKSLTWWGFDHLDDFWETMVPDISRFTRKAIFENLEQLGLSKDSSRLLAYTIVGLMIEYVFRICCNMDKTHVPVFMLAAVGQGLLAPWFKRNVKNHEFLMKIGFHTCFMVFFSTIIMTDLAVEETPTAVENNYSDP